MIKVNSCISCGNSKNRVSYATSTYDTNNYKVNDTNTSFNFGLIKTRKNNSINITNNNPIFNTNTKQQTYVVQNINNESNIYAKDGFLISQSKPQNVIVSHTFNVEPNSNINTSTQRVIKNSRSPVQMLNVAPMNTATSVPNFASHKTQNMAKSSIINIGKKSRTNTTSITMPSSPGSGQRINHIWA